MSQEITTFSHAFELLSDGLIKDKKRASKIFMYLSFFSIALLIGAILLPFMA